MKIYILHTVCECVYYILYVNVSGRGEIVTVGSSEAARAGLSARLPLRPETMVDDGYALE